MSYPKTISGRIGLEKNNIMRAVLFYSIAVVVLITAMIIKIALFSNVSFENPLLAYFLLSSGAIFFMVAYFIYIYHSRAALIVSGKMLYSVTAAVVLTYILNIYLALADVVAMPVYLSAFIIAPISKRRDAFNANIFANCLTFCTLIIEVFLGDSISLAEITVMFVVGIVSGTIASYTISNDTKRLNYIIKGFLIGISSLVVVLFFSYFTNTARDSILNVAIYSAIGMFSPLFMGLLMQPLFETAFNLVTNSRLVELTDSNAPLIKRLRLETPGTFNHCMAVANFAETCASAIGENPYLARACAYYHDVGKLANAIYFKENQGDVNPHDELLPEVSADIIRSHTTEGLKLCNQYRIPYEVSHVTVQHHGTALIPVFYEKAKKLTDGDVDTEEYSYHGITPVTKVAAIIMLCDVGEAAIRAMVAPDGEKVNKLLSGIINDRIRAGQFDNCDISLRDLDTIKKTIISAYGGLFHKRMEYPNGK